LADASADDGTNAGAAGGGSSRINSAPLPSGANPTAAHQGQHGDRHIDREEDDEGSDDDEDDDEQEWPEFPAEYDLRHQSINVVDAKTELDIMWQDGSISCGIPSLLVREAANSVADEHAMMPGEFVILQSDDADA